MTSEPTDTSENPAPLAGSSDVRRTRAASMEGAPEGGARVLTSAADSSILERRAPIRLTRLPWTHPTMLAPMEGITHPAFRAMACERGGVGIVCTEFVRIGRNALSARALQAEVVRQDGVPLSVQVMGNLPEQMAEAAGWMSRAGADGIDINCGCPAPRIVRKGVGAAMLKDPRLLYEVVSAMRARVEGLLSAKIRAGFDDAGDALGNARVLEAAGIDYLVVHPRRRADFYEGVADWRIIRLLRESLRIPVVGNGDAWYAAAAIRMMRETGCDAVMLGRPAIRNPWIFEQIADLRAGRAPRRPDGKLLLAWIGELIARWSCIWQARERNPVGAVKEMLAYVLRAVPDGGALRTRVLRAESLDLILDACGADLSSRSAEAIDLDAEGTLGLERCGTVG